MEQSAIELKDIKATKKLTLSQKAVLGEIHSLVSRGNEFYAWNSYLSEKLGIGRSTAANAMTFFYKNGILKSKNERNDGRTKRITKRTVQLHYNKLALFLGVSEQSQTHIQQPPHKPSKEKPVHLIQKYEDIDFAADEKAVFKQWADYMIATLDRKTGMVNPITREKNALRGILDDARRMINSSHNNEMDNAISKIRLMQDRRIENGILYCLDRMILDEKEANYWGNEEWEMKTVNKSNLNYSWMRNIYKPWTEVFSLAIKKDYFKPWEDIEQDIFYTYRYNSGVSYSQISAQEEGENDYDYYIRIIRSGFYWADDYIGWCSVEKDKEDEYIQAVEKARLKAQEDQQEEPTKSDEMEEREEVKLSPLEVMKKLREEFDFVDDFTEEEKELIRDDEERKKAQNNQQIILPRV